MGDGLREALRVGTGNVVAKLGQTDGLYTDKAIRTNPAARTTDLLKKVFSK